MHICDSDIDKLKTLPDCMGLRLLSLLNIINTKLIVQINNWQHIHLLFLTSDSKFKSEVWLQTHPFLNELEGTLVFGHLQQLHGTPFIGGKATHLANHVANKLTVFGQALRTEDTMLSSVMLQIQPSYARIGVSAVGTSYTISFL